MRLEDSVDNVPVLAFIGVTHNGFKTVLGLQSGDKESASSWREFFKDLKQRGLNTDDVCLGVMDGLPSLETVFKEEFTHAKTQRCQVHVALNVLAKFPKKLKKKSLMKYVPSSMLPPKRRPNSFSETLKKRDSRISLKPSNVFETLWNPA